MITEPVYITREDVKRATDVKSTARTDAQIDSAIESASRAAEGFLHRQHFYPLVATRYFDWPDRQSAKPWRLWLDDSDLISIDTLSSGGVVISTNDYNLEPNRSGPPFSRVEIKTSSDAAFGGGPTSQRDITITGLWGYANSTKAVGATAEALDAAEAGIDVDGATSAAVGVGSVLQIDDERFLVTDRAQLTTGQTLQTPLTSQNNNETVTVSDGTAFTTGEVLLLDSERMLVVDIAGNNLTVKRAWDGSTLAAHTGSTVYAQRALTVVRGALGTTATTHLAAASVLVWQPPSLLRQLVKAETLNDLQQETSGYARTVGSGESERESTGGGLKDIRDRAYRSLGRKGRTRAV